VSGVAQQRVFPTCHYNPPMRQTLFAILLLLSTPLHADYREFLDAAPDPALATKLRMAAEATLRAYPKLKAEDLAISMIDVTQPHLISRADFQGDAPFYPASVIKLFFMADVFLTHKEKVGDVDRALKEMISVSDNDATAYLVDVLASTVPGPPLEGRALRRFIARRRAINLNFQKLGYADNVSAMMKPWSFGPFGVDRQVLGENRVNRNKLTANATASLMLWIQRLRAPGAHEMMTLLHRPLAPLRDEENQVKEFIGEALPAESQLWSKAGWTSEVRHDAAYIELPSGKKFVLVIFTRGTAEDVTLIPAIARNVLAEL
jgi:beta-lactamase class A